MPPLNSCQKSLLAIAISQSLIATSHAATISVNSLDDVLDSNIETCTLREALTTVITVDRSSPTAIDLGNGCGLADGNNDTIRLPSGKITLSSALPIVSSDVTLQGSGSNTNSVTSEISGANSHRVLTIDAGDNNNATPAVDVVIDRVKISEGSGNRGAGINVSEEANLRIQNSIVSDNTASIGSGGIYFYGQYSNDIVIENSLFTRNAAEFSTGGAMRLYGANSATIINSTISENTSRGPGAAVYQYESNSFTINNSTIVNNVSELGPGGGIVSRYTNATIRNSIVSGNSTGTGVNGQEIYLYDAVATIDNSVIGSDAASTANNFVSYDSNLTQVVPIIINGSNVDASSDVSGGLALEAIVDPLADNGGASSSHSLPEASPAVSLGDNVTCEPTDQRMRRRPRNTQNECDAGAYEIVSESDSSFFVIPLSGGKAAIIEL